MTERHSQLAALLIDVECAMRNLDLWNQERPSDVALASQQPFCIDTLDFSQWLQFVFIERMRVMTEAQTPLPANCGIAPMAEEYFRDTPRSGEDLIVALKEIDDLLTR